MRWVRLRSLGFSDFRGFVGGHNIELPEKGLVRIHGTNKNTGDSSDSGKTTILLALQYLLGDCKIPSTELQSWHSQNNMSVTGTFDTDDGVLEITRGPSLFRVSLDGKKIQGKAADKESKIDDLLGIEKKLRSDVTYRGQRRNGVFLHMSDTEKKVFFTRLLGLDKFEKALDKSEATIKSLAAKESTAEHQMSLQQGWVERYRDLIGQSPLEPDTEDPEALEQEASALEAEGAAKNTETEEEVARIWKEGTSNVQPLKDELERLRISTVIETPEIDSKIEKATYRLSVVVAHDVELEKQYNQKLKESAAALHELEKEVATYNQLKNRLPDAELELAALLKNTCPTCSQTWADSLQAAEKTQKEVDHIRSQQDPTKKYLVAKSEYDCLENSRPKPHPTRTQLEQIITELQRQKTQFQNDEHARIANKMGDISRSIEEANRALRIKIDAMRTTTSAEIAVLNKQASDLRVRAAGVRVARDNYNQALAKYKQDVTELTNAETALKQAGTALAQAQQELAIEEDFKDMLKGFLGVIFDEVLEEVATTANDIFSRVANIQKVSIRFEMDKTAKTSGNIQQRITAVVSVDGRDVRFETGLSGGMQEAVELGVDLAVGEVIARRRGAYLGWLILDECFDGLGPVSKESCMDMLNNFASERLVLIVDHASTFDGAFSHTIEVESVDEKCTLL